MPIGFIGGGGEVLRMDSLRMFEELKFGHSGESGIVLNLFCMVPYKFLTLIT